jgi:uncharacterized protein YjbI with pentapeptide repeats
MNKVTSPRHAFRLDVHGAFLRSTDLSNANLEGANLSGADFTNASLRGSNLRNADLHGTIFRGADLTDTMNLTDEQIKAALIDERSRLPASLAAASPAK